MFDFNSVGLYLDLAVIYKTEQGLAPEQFRVDVMHVFTPLKHLLVSEALRLHRKHTVLLLVHLPKNHRMLKNDGL